MASIEHSSVISPAKDWVRVTSDNTIKVSVKGYQYDITLNGTLNPEKTKQIEALFKQSIKEQGGDFQQALEKLSSSKDKAYIQIKNAHKYKFVIDSSQSGKQIIGKFKHVAKEGEDNVIHTHSRSTAAPPIKAAKPAAEEEEVVAAAPEEVVVGKVIKEEQQEEERRIEESQPEVVEKQSLHEAQAEDLVDKAATPIASPAPKEQPIASAPRPAVKSLQEQLQEKQTQLKSILTPDVLPKPPPNPLPGALDAQGLADLAARRAAIEEEPEDPDQQGNFV